ncbi:MAG: hemerythrin domain-containing protein [Pseudomonadota bacterium]
MTSLTETFSPDATNMIRLDHTHVLATFHQYKTSSRPQVKRGLVNTACIALEIHAQLEEEIFYPAVRELTDNEALRKAVPEHDEMRRLIALLRSMEPTDVRYDATFMELMRDVLHHVADEETVVLPEAERLLEGHLGDLGMRMTKRRLQLAAPRAGEIAANMARALPGPSLAVTLSMLAAGLWLGMRIARA